MHTETQSAVKILTHQTHFEDFPRRDAQKKKTTAPILWNGTFRIVNLFSWSRHLMRASFTDTRKLAMEYRSCLYFVRARQANLLVRPPELHHFMGHFAIAWQTLTYALKTAVNISDFYYNCFSFRPRHWVGWKLSLMKGWSLCSVLFQCWFWSTLQWKSCSKLVWD